MKKALIVISTGLVFILLGLFQSAIIAASTHSTRHQNPPYPTRYDTYWHFHTHGQNIHGAAKRAAFRQIHREDPQSAHHGLQKY